MSCSERPAGAARPPLRTTLKRAALLVAMTILFAFAGGEAALRLTTSDQRNYPIEMWRYARELKVPADPAELGHVHRPDAAALLQGVEISINSLGMRGPEPRLAADGVRRVLLLGNSVTFGWGVPEDQTMRAQLAARLGPTFDVLNAGIGNINLVRYIALFDRMQRRLKPCIVVVNAHPRDAIDLPPSRGSWLIRHSEFAVVTENLIETWRLGGSMDALVDHYRTLWAPGGANLAAMRAALNRLQRIQQEDGFEVVLAVVPDIHRLPDYPLAFVDDWFRDEAAKRGWRFLDYRDALAGHSGPDLWAMPTDPHPNGVGHTLMAAQLADVIAKFPRAPAQPQ